MRTVVCLGSGPSLTQEDVDRCRAFECIAINDTVAVAPWATVCYAGDFRWWLKRDGLPWFTGRKASMVPFDREAFPDVEVFRNGGPYGLDLDPGTLRNGGNSGYAAINFAVTQLQAQRIVLVGYDMRATNGRHHHHDDNGHHPAYETCCAAFETLVKPLASRGVTVFNASRVTALRAFPRVSLDCALA